MKRLKEQEIINYDDKDTTLFINKSKPLKISDLGFELPEDFTDKSYKSTLTDGIIEQSESICGSARCWLYFCD